MNTNVDLLQIKIDKAKRELPEESKNAIDAVDWKNIIVGMRAEKGYSFTQLEDLELETELLLCGLLSSEDYPKELEKRMGMPRAKVEELVNEMNEKVFKKIREELVKIIERKKIFENKKTITPEAKQLLENSDILKTTNNKETQTENREELLKNIENPPKTPSILSQKLSGSFQIPGVETEHTLSNITKDTSILQKPKVGIPKVDPYRELPQ